MRLIDADKIEYYPVDRNGKHIGEMVWKPHIDGIETFNLEEHDKQIRAELIEELCNRHSDDNSWCEFTIDVIVAELEEIAQELKK